MVTHPRCPRAGSHKFRRLVLAVTFLSVPFSVCAGPCSDEETANIEELLGEGDAPLCQVLTSSQKPNKRIIHAYPNSVCAIGSDTNIVPVSISRAKDRISTICSIDDDVAYLVTPSVDGELSQEWSAWTFTYLDSDGNPNIGGSLAITIANDHHSWPRSKSTDEADIDRVTISLGAIIPGDTVSFPTYLQGMKYPNITYQFPSTGKFTANNSTGEITFTEQSIDLDPFDVQLMDGFSPPRTLTVNIVELPKYEDNPSLASLRIELAMTRKVRADEAFIRLGTLNIASAEEQKLEARSKELYKGAQASLDAIRIERDDLRPEQLSTIELLRKDIEYRLILLNAGVGYWGGYRTLKPTTPHHEWIKLSKLMDEFEKIQGNMQDFEMFALDAQVDTARLEAERAKVLGQVQALRFQEEIGTVSERKFNNSIENNKRSIEGIKERLTNITATMDAIAQAQDSLTASAASLTNDIIASSTGLPVGAVNALASGDVKSAIEDVVVSELADPNSDLSIQFASMGEQAKEFAAMGRELNEQFREIKELEQQVHYVTGALRDPTWEGFLKSGEIIYSRMDRQTRRKIDKELNRIVEKQKPNVAFLQSAYDYAKEGEKELKEWQAMATKLLQDEFNYHEDVINNYIRKEVDRIEKIASESGEEILREYTARVVSSIKDVEGEYETITRELAKVYPSILESASSSFKRAVIQQFPGEDLEDIARRIHNMDDAFDIEDNVLILTQSIGGDVRRVATTRLDDMIEDIKVDVDKVVSPSVDDARRLVEGAIKAGTDVERMMIATLEPGVTHSLLVRATEANVKEGGEKKNSDIWRALHTSSAGVVKNANSSMKSAAITSLSNTYANQKQAENNKPTVDIPKEVFMPGSSGMDPQAEAAAKMALNAAFPGAGAALSLAQTWGAMDANRELNESLSQEALGLMADYNQLVGETESLEFDGAISRVEQERARALKVAAREQQKAFSQSVDNSINSTAWADQRIRMYRPLYFYMAERMRERFDIFDRSLAMWSGNKDGRGFVFSEIRNNPQNLRLALDSEIQLFDWLNRDRESTKTDPFYLYLHWKKLTTLVDDYCADSGCKPGSGNLGEISISHPQMLFKDILGGRAKQEFVDWKEDMQNQAFETSFLLSPANRLAPPEYTNLRILKINVVAVDENGDRLPGDLLRLGHSGSALIPYIDASTSNLRFRWENLSPRESLVSNDLSGIDKQVLEERLAKLEVIENLQPLADFEGYGLYGQYDVEIRDVVGVEDVADFEIQFAYIFIDPDEAQSEEELLTMYRSELSFNEIEAVRNVFGVTSEEDGCPIFDTDWEYDSRYAYLTKVDEPTSRDVLEREVIDSLYPLKSCYNIVPAISCRTTESYAEILWQEEIAKGNEPKWSDLMTRSQQTLGGIDVCNR